MLLPATYTLAYDYVMEDNYSARLKKAMQAAGVTQYKLSRMSGVPQPTISRILKGVSRIPTADKLEALADALDISFGWLMSGDGPMGADDAKRAEAQYREAEAEWDRTKDFDAYVLAMRTDGFDPAAELGITECELEAIENDEKPVPEWFQVSYRSAPTLKRSHELEFVGRMDAWDSKTPLDEDEVELPLFREVELAAGAGQTEVIENHGAKLRFAKSTLARAGVQKENAACAFVRGNSMEPVMPDGTCVGVNTGDTAIRDGEIYAIDHGGMLRVKYLHRRPGGGLKIVSQNAGEHPVEDIPANEMAASVRIIGRVFWWSVLR